MEDQDDSISEVPSASHKKSKHAARRHKGMGALYILVMAVFFKFINVVTKKYPKEDKIEEVCCDSKLVAITPSTSSEYDMITASKLHSLMTDTLTMMSLRSSLKNLSSEMQIRPEVLLDLYPVYGPGVGPAIDRLLSSPTPPTRQELMANELLRLCTFHNYPACRIVSCLLMAKAGLYYNGHNDEVTCYSCNKSIAEWTLAADPYEVHKERSPTCNHLLWMDTQNTPEGAAMAPPSRTAGETRSDNTTSQATAAKSATSANATSISSNADTGYSTGAMASEFVDTAGSKFSSPPASAVSTADNNISVAAASDDSNISSGGSDRHRSSTPGSKNGSLPIGSESNSGPPSSGTNSWGPGSGTNSIGIQDTFIPRNNNPTQPSTSHTIVNTPVAGYTGPANPQRSRAYYPDYVLPADRLKTYETWPADIRQSPQKMLESGFFYAGYEDCVRCFQCGIGLRNWEPPDNPHVEHARWSPRCAFLLQVKGHDFINLVMDAVAQLEERRNNPAAIPATTESTPQTSSNNNTVATTAETQQNSASGSSHRNATPSITPSGTPSATPNPTATGPPSERAATATSNLTAAPPSGRAAAAKPNPTTTAPPSGRPTATLNLKTSTPSSGRAAATTKPTPGRDTKGAENVSTKHSITVDNVCTNGVTTGSDKTKGLTDVMKTEAIRRLLQDGYGEDNVRAALRILLDTKGAAEITEGMIREIVKKNTSVRNRRPGLNGGGEGTAEPLSAELQLIKKENREMRERTVCKICLEDQVSIAFMPCGHLVACGQCAHAITRCAVCRKPITNKILTHMDV